MTTQFRMHDSATKPQIVSVRWEMVTPRDDCSDRPDTRDDGFWPSKDKNDAGYVAPKDYTEQMKRAKARMAAWEDDEWCYVGVIARAHIDVPVGGGSFATYTLDSPGLWGIESDCGDYIAEVFEDEKAQLLSHLKVMGAHFAEVTP